MQLHLPFIRTENNCSGQLKTLNNASAPAALYAKDTGPQDFVVGKPWGAGHGALTNP